MALDKVTTGLIADDSVTGAKIENNPTVSGNLTVAGNTTLSGTSTLTGNATASGNLTVTGDIIPSSPLSNRNYLINGDFQICQRTHNAGDGQARESFSASTAYWKNDDDSYTLDRWKLFSDGDDIVDVSQYDNQGPDNQHYSLALDVETADKKFGIAQIIEKKNIVGLIGNTVTLSFKAKVSATTKLDKIKAAIISWTGTGDAVTSDPISAWGAEGTNPTLVTNYTYENTPANLNTATSWTDYSVTGTIDTTGTQNIMVLIWSDVTDTTAGDFLYLADVQLERGSVATPFERRSHADVLYACRRYCYRVGWWGDHDNCYVGTGYFWNTVESMTIFEFPCDMRDKCALTVTGSHSNFGMYNTGGSIIGAASGNPYLLTNGRGWAAVQIRTSSSCGTGGSSSVMRLHYPTYQSLIFHKEL